MQLQKESANQNQAQVCCPLVRCVKFLMGKDWLQWHCMMNVTCYNKQYHYAPNKITNRCYIYNNIVCIRRRLILCALPSMTLYTIMICVDLWSHIFYWPTHVTSLWYHYNNIIGTHYWPARWCTFLSYCIRASMSIIVIDITNPRASTHYRHCRFAITWEKHTDQ